MRSSMLFLKKKVCFEKKLCPFYFFLFRFLLSFFYFKRSPQNPFFYPSITQKEKCSGLLNISLKSPRSNFFFFHFLQRKGKRVLIRAPPFYEREGAAF